MVVIGVQGGGRGKGRKKKYSVKCRRGRATGHYSNDNCTTRLCERCGGRGHDSSKFPSPADMEDGSQEGAEAVLAPVESCRRNDGVLKRGAKAVRWEQNRRRPRWEWRRAQQVARNLIVRTPLREDCGGAGSGGDGKQLCTFSCEVAQ